MATIGFQKFFFALFVLIGCLFVSANPVSGGSSDKYEPDNTMETAKLINPNPMLPEDLLPPGYEWKQSHNFYTYGDEDWVYFYGRRGEIYTIRVQDVGEKCDPVIEIRNSKREKVIKPVDDYREGKSEYAEFRCEADDTYYVRIRQCDLKDSACHASYGEDTQYSLILYIPAMNGPGLLVLNNLPIGVTITLNTPEWNNWEVIPSSQTLKRLHGSDTFSLTASAQGYETCSQQVTIIDGKTSSYDICLKKDSCVFVDNDLALNLCAEYIGKKYGCTLNSVPNQSDPKGWYWKMDVSTFRELSSDPGNCIGVGSDLKLNLCAEYQGHNYGFTMNFYPNPNDPSGLYWKMDLSTFREVQ